MLVRLPPVFFSLPSHGAPSVKLRILQNFTLNLRNSWSINLRAIENCICGQRSTESKMRSILWTVRTAVFCLFLSNLSLTDEAVLVSPNRRHPFVTPCSRIHRSLTRGYSQLWHRVVVPARQATWMAGRYENPLPELTLSPSQGSMNSATGIEEGHSTSRLLYSCFSAW
jgi:hypothetical protein